MLSAYTKKFNIQLREQSNLCSYIYKLSTPVVVYRKQSQAIIGIRNRERERRDEMDADARMRIYFTANIEMLWMQGKNVI